MRRARLTGQAAVFEQVDKIINRFEYPDESGGGGAVVLGGGGGAPSVVVAASDATELSKAKADYLCTGVADQQVIQQALDSLSGSIGRCVLTEGTFYTTEVITVSNGTSLVGMASAGTYIIAAAASFNGVGFEAPMVIMGDGGELANLTVQGSGFADIAGVLVTDASSIGTCKVVNCYISAEDYYAVRVSTGITIIADNELITNSGGTGVDITGGTGVVVSGNNIFGVDAGIDNQVSGSFICGNTIDSGIDGIVTSAAGAKITGNTISGLSGDCVVGTGVNCLIFGNVLEGLEWGVHNEGDQDWTIQGNQFISNQGILIDNNGDATVIKDNYFDTGGQILFDGGSFEACVVDGNVFNVGGSGPSVDGVVVFDNGAVDCQIINNQIFDANSDDAIRVTGATDVMIAANQIGEGAAVGIVVTSGLRCQVIANSVKWAGEHGISFAGDLSLVSDNHVFGSGQNNTNTYDNFLVAGDGTTVEGNQSEPATTAPLTRYGVNIASGSDNAVYANQLGDSSAYGTADSVDSGTSTQTSPSAGAIGGQFAY